jgi:hypothetical protein
VEPELDDSLCVEEIIGNTLELIAAIGSAEVSNVSSESKTRKITGSIDLEETLQLSEAKRAEQVDQRLKLDRDRLEFEQARQRSYMYEKTNVSNLFPVKTICSNNNSVIIL